MEVHEGGLAAGLRVEIGRAGRNAFMQVYDVLELRIVEQGIEQRTFGRAGVAEDPVDPVIDQRFQQNLTSTHPMLSL